MIFELTLFASFTLYHLIIGVCLLLLLSALFRLVRVSAEVQSWLWATAFVIATIAPFATFASIPEAVPAQAAIAMEQTVSLPRGGGRDAAPGTALRPIIVQDSQPGDHQPQWHVPGEFVFEFTAVFYLFMAVWALGSVRRAWQVCRSGWQTRHLRASANPLRAGSRLTSLSPFPLLESAAINTPMAIGLVSPVIVIPSSLAARFSHKQLAPVILHELAHIERSDLWVGLFQETLAIVFWWSPVMRILNHRIHIARELACDMRAASRLASGKQYAQSLLDCAQLMVSERSNALAMGLFTQKKELNHRINEVLKTKNIKAPSALTTAIICLGLAAGTVSVAEAYVPAINVPSVQQEANYFSKLSEAEGERLMAAIRKKDRTTISQMVKDGLDINTPIIGDGTALIIAVRYGDADMVTWLMAQGASVNQAARGDGNPLIMAAMKGNLDLTKLLLEKGAKVDAIVPGDETALITASRRGHADVVKYLVGRGADVNLGVEVMEVHDGATRTVLWTPLNKAANRSIRQFLKDAGAKS